MPSDPKEHFLSLNWITCDNALKFIWGTGTSVAQKSNNREISERFEEDCTLLRKARLLAVLAREAVALFT